MDTLLTDLRFALRTMRRNPIFTVIAVAALALGIGANTAIFTVVDTVLLQPLPYPQPDRIVQLVRQFQAGRGNSVSIPKFMAWRQNDQFDAMALYDFGALVTTLGTGSPPQQASVVHVSADYFKVFGVSPVAGRTFTPGEDRPGGPRVAVIAYGVWQSKLGGSPGVLGRTVLLGGAPYSIVGILPTGFHADPEADVWIPLQADPASTNEGHYLRAAGRLKAGVTLAAAQAEMDVIGSRFRTANPKWMSPDEGIAVVPMQEAVSGDVRPALLVLFGAVALVLLIACANVANLLLSRAAGRQREIAVRSALGASRARVVRQLLTESVLLAGCGGLLGFGLGAWGLRVLLLLVPGNIPRLTDVRGAHAAPALLDARVMAFTLALSLVTGIVFGLIPALHASKPDLTATLKEASGRSGTGVRQHRLRSLLVVSEFALALVLLVGAALLIRTFVGLRSVDPGLDPRHVLTLQTSLAGSGYTSTAKVDAFVTRTVRQLEALPGIEAAASAVVLPVEGSIDLPFAIPAHPPAKGDYNGDEQWRSVSPHYFRAFSIPLLRGRAFAEADAGASTHVVIINDAMARRYWPNEDALGQLIVIGKGLGPEFDDPPRQIVGIVGNVHENGLNRSGVGVMYIPQSQVPEGLTALGNNVVPLSWIVRTVGDPMSTRAAVEREMRRLDGQLPISHVRTMEQVISEAVARQNFNMVLLSIFAGVALVLAAIGIYGVMAYAVQQRTQELGIRMALGATPVGILRLVLTEGLRLTGAGVAVGLVLAYGASRLLTNLLFGVKTTDPLAFGLVAAVLTLCGLVATYWPAQRATKVDPALALRYE